MVSVTMIYAIRNKLNASDMKRAIKNSIRKCLPGVSCSTVQSEVLRFEIFLGAIRNIGGGQNGVPNGPFWAIKSLVEHG